MPSSPCCLESSLGTAATPHAVAAPQATARHVGSEDDLRDEIARRNAAKADAPRVPTTQPEPTDPLGFALVMGADASVRLEARRFLV